MSDATEDLTQKHGHASDSVEKLRDVLGEAKEGSKKLSDATEDLTQKHGHASDSVEKLFDVLGEAKEGSEKLSDATEDLTQKHEHASDSVEKLHLNHRALHTIMSMIGRETSPQLGHALMGAMYGPLGLVIALGAAVEEVRNKFQDYMKDLDAQGAEAAKPAFDAIKNIASEWDTAKKKMGEYMAAVAEAGKNKDAFDQQMKQDKELTDAKIEGIKKIIESLGKEEVARLQAGGASSQEIAAAEGRTKEEIDRLEDSKKDGDIARLKKELAERNAPGTQMTLDEQAQEKSAASESAAVQLKKMRNQNLKACVTAMMERGRLASSLWPSWRNLRRALMLLKVSNSPRPM